MNLLDAVPALSHVIDRVIPNPNEKERLRLELQKLDAAENLARVNVVGKMLSNNNFFVAGGIPALIWLAVLYIMANYILFPLLAGFGMKIAPINLPNEYWSLLQIVIVGLFGKKVIDGNEWWIGGKLVSPGKSQVEAAAAKGDVKPVGARIKPVETKLSVDYNDPAVVDRRLKEIAKEKGIM